MDNEKLYREIQKMRNQRNKEIHIGGRDKFPRSLLVGYLVVILMIVSGLFLVTHH